MLNEIKKVTFSILFNSMEKALSEEQRPPSAVWADRVTSLSTRWARAGGRAKRRGTGPHSATEH